MEHICQEVRPEAFTDKLLREALVHVKAELLSWLLDQRAEFTITKIWVILAEYGIHLGGKAHGSYCLPSADGFENHGNHAAKPSLQLGLTERLRLQRL